MYANRLALQNAVIAETVRTGDSGFAGLCPEFITRAEQRLFKGLKPLMCREMETRSTLTVTAGVSATPANFLSARRLTWVAALPYDLTYREPEDFYSHGGRYGMPSIYTIDGTVIDVLSPATGTATLSYYAKPAALAADLDTNTTLAAHGHCYLAAALIEAFGYLRNDAKTEEWATKFVEAVDGVNKSAVKARYAGTKLSPRVPGAYQYGR